MYTRLPTQTSVSLLVITSLLWVPSFVRHFLEPHLRNLRPSLLPFPGRRRKIVVDKHYSPSTTSLVTIIYLSPPFEVPTVISFKNPFYKSNTEYLPLYILSDRLYHTYDNWYVHSQCLPCLFLYWFHSIRRVYRSVPERNHEYGGNNGTKSLHSIIIFL